MTSISGMPTDSFYKFFAISGVALFVLSVSFFSEKISELWIHIDQVSLEKSLLVFRFEQLSNELDELKVESNALKSKMKKYHLTPSANLSIDVEELRGNINDKNYRDKLQFICTYKEFIIPEINDNLNLEKKLNKLKVKQDECHTAKIELEHKQNILNRLSNMIIFWYIVTIIFIVVSSYMSYFGFRRWYYLIQKPADILMLKELAKMKENPETRNVPLYP